MEGTDEHPLCSPEKAAPDSFSPFPTFQQSWECLCSKRVGVNAVCYSPLLSTAFLISLKKKSYELGPPSTHPPTAGCLPNSWHSTYETLHGEFHGGQGVGNSIA